MEIFADSIPFVAFLQYVRAYRGSASFDFRTRIHFLYFRFLFFRLSNSYCTTLAGFQAQQNISAPRITSSRLKINASTFRRDLLDFKASDSSTMTFCHFAEDFDSLAPQLLWQDEGFNPKFRTPNAFHEKINWRANRLAKQIQYTRGPHSFNQSKVLRVEEW